MSRYGQVSPQSYLYSADISGGKLKLPGESISHLEVFRRYKENADLASLHMRKSASPAMLRHYQTLSLMLWNVT